MSQQKLQDGCNCLLHEERPKDRPTHLLLVHCECDEIVDGREICGVGIHCQSAWRKSANDIGVQCLPNCNNKDSACSAQAKTWDVGLIESIDALCNVELLLVADDL